MSKPQVVVDFENVSKTFVVGTKDNNSIMDRAMSIFSSSSRKKIHALNNVNFQIEKGDFVGIVGHNGSGKSTLLRLILGSFPPDKGGRISVVGRALKLSLGMGFDLNLTARENIYVNGSIIGLTFKTIGKKFDEIIDFAGIPDFVDTQVKYFSSGMVSRLAFAIAIHAEADILLLDEFFGGVGDYDFRVKSEAAFKQAFIDKKTLIYVSHEIVLVKQLCNKLIVLNKGNMEFCGSVQEGLDVYNEIYGIV